jgi:hypothetical protein
MISTMLTLFLLLLSTAYACHPACIWSCNSPPCVAHCQPLCAEPNCTYHCPDLMPPQAGTAECQELGPLCTTQCPVNQCENASCPVCETLCAPPPLFCAAVNCTIQCAAPNCTWNCHKPTNCAHPTCALNCEEPACPRASYASASALHVSALLLLLLLIQ